MNFLNPAAFIGLLSVPVIVAFYLLKQKHESRIIPSLFLWEKALLNSQSQRPWQKLRKNILLFLQLLMAIVLVVILAGPYINYVKSTANHIYLLDASMSMQAEDVSGSRFLEAKKRIRQAVKGLPPESKATLIVMCKNPYIAVNQSSDKNMLLNTLDGIKPTYSDVDEEAAGDLLRMLLERETADVFSYSDRIYPSIGNVNNTIIGGAADNVAITAMSHHVDADRTVVLVKVKNFSETIKSATVNLFDGNKIHDLKEIKIEPFSETDVFFTDVNVNSGELTAVLSDDDYLLADNTRYDVVTKSDKRKVLLVTEQNIFLEKALGALPGVELYRGGAEISKGYHLYVFDGVLPNTMPTDGHLLIINPPEGNSFIQTDGQAEIDGITVYQTPLFDFIAETDFDVGKSKKITLPSWGVECVSSIETPLVISGEVDNRKVIVIGFDLHDSDLPLRKEFPIFMYNIMRYLVPEDVIKNLSSGTVDFNVLPEAQKVRVIAPNGEITAIAPPFPPLSYDTDLPGVYILEQTSDDETFFSSFAVNPDTNEESNLMTDNVDSGDENISASVVSRRNLRRPLMILLIIIFFLEWWVYSRDF